MASTVEELEIDECLKPSKVYNYSECTFEILSGEIEYKKFYEDFIYTNMPCVIKNISRLWECNNKWVINNFINFDYFIEEYGELQAPVADCGTLSYNAQSKNNYCVSDYIHYLRSVERDKLLYLKDWHLRRLRPGDKFYEVPAIFCSDWLNEYALDHQEDDFMFVYIGPQDSWTPLHADVYNSFSWSVNIIGRKKWIFFPPQEEEKLKDHLGNLPVLFDHMQYENIKYFEIIQERGDAVFVPSGWHHQVINEIDTISINHNWINACNIEEVWKALNKCLSSVEHEIAEFKDTPEYVDQCQLILKSMFGMDFEYYINFITYIAKKRLDQLKGYDRIVFQKYLLGTHHIMFDLKKLIKVIDLFNNHPLIVNKCIKIHRKYDPLNIKQSFTDLERQKLEF